MLFCFLVSSCVRLLATPWAEEPGGLLCPRNFPGKNTAVGCHFLLQGNLPDPGTESSLKHWQVGSWPLSHQESP